MTQALLKRINLDAIYPGLLHPLLDTLDACTARGANYYALSGYRTFAEQARDYFQGRTAPGKIVTNAKPGFSPHNYGIAVDLCRDADFVKVGLQPEWGLEGYAILREEGERRGLQVGVPGAKSLGGDVGHVQLPLAKKLQKREFDVLLELKKIYESGPQEEALKRVWARLDELGFGVK